LGQFAPKGLIGSFLILPIIGWSAYRVQFVLHDTCHMSLFDSRKLNDRVGTLSGLLVGIYFPRYRTIHFLHHKYNGLIEDPQLPDYLSDENVTSRQYVKFLFEPLWGMRLIPYLRRDLLEARVVKTDIPQPNFIWFAQLAAVQSILLMVLTDFGAKWYYAPFHFFGMATFSLFLSRLRALSEHQQIGTNYSDFSRTHPKNWLDSVLLSDANFCYHLEHHLYPSVQSRHLPDLLRELTSELHTKDSLGTTMVKTLVQNFSVLKVKNG